MTKNVPSFAFLEARARLLHIISNRLHECRGEKVSVALQELLGQGWKIIEKIPGYGSSFRPISDEERIQCIKELPAGEQFGGDMLTIDDFFALWNEPGRVTLQWLYEEQGVTCLYFGGTTLLDPANNERVYIVLQSTSKSSWFFSGAYAPGYGPDLRQIMQRRND